MGRLRILAGYREIRYTSPNWTRNALNARLLIVRLWVLRRRFGHRVALDEGMEPSRFQPRSDPSNRFIVQWSHQDSLHRGIGAGRGHRLKTLAVEPLREYFGYSRFYRHELKIRCAGYGRRILPDGGVRGLRRLDRGGRRGRRRRGHQFR